MPGESTINIRLTQQERDRIKAAAIKQRRSLTSFALFAMLEEADRTLGQEQPAPPPAPEEQLVSTTVEPAELPPIKLNPQGYPQLPEHAREEIELRGKRPGDTVLYRGIMHRV